MQQRALAGPALPDDGEQLALLDRNVDALQDGNKLLSLDVPFAQFRNDEQVGNFAPVNVANARPILLLSARARRGRLGRDALDSRFRLFRLARFRRRGAFGARRVFPGREFRFDEIEGRVVGRGVGFDRRVGRNRRGTELFAQAASSFFPAAFEPSPSFILSSHS